MAKLAKGKAQGAWSVQATLPIAPPPKTPLPPVMPFDWACAYGEDECGLWQAFEVEGVRQVMRWIPPGEFWMGSTSEERERFALGSAVDDESPRHRVTHTQGFWLADTACSLSLWRAVTGDKPSRFNEDLALPVETVSWNDITGRFLPELNRRLPGLDLVLPTEAQWEYACRAGTDTAYWFGELITREQVNFNGNNPPQGERPGLIPEETVPVKSLPANGWGLHEMHGNVWEWCRDSQRQYAAGPVEDAQGPLDQEAGLRVIRGGSWGSTDRNCRSAYRDANRPDRRGGNLGFRLSRGPC